MQTSNRDYEVTCVLKVKVISLPYIIQVLYVLCFTNVKISGERLQDQWSSGYEDLTKIIFELSSNIIKYAPYSSADRSTVKS